jgi:hypothetical protein
MDTPSSTYDEGSEVDVRSQSDYADFDEPLSHRREASSDVSSECSGEPGSPYGSPYPRWPVCALPARLPQTPLLKRLSTTRRSEGGVRDGKAGDSGMFLLGRSLRLPVCLSVCLSFLLDKLLTPIAVNSQSCS